MHFGCFQCYQLFVRQMGDTKLCFWGNNQSNLLSQLSHASYNRPQQISTSFDIIDISASEKHISFITKEGALYSYGLNLDGRLGVGGRPEAKCTIQNPALVKLSTRAVKVKCGFSHIVVQLINDELFSWGLGQYGSLGTGELRSKFMPTRVILKEKIVNFSCGAMHTGFVDNEGKVYLCGSNEYGEIGVNKPDKVTTPTAIDFIHKVKQVECGVFYTLLLTTNGQVYGMGNNKYSQLGIGNKINQWQPTHIKELDKIVLLAAGYHSGAIDCEGSLYIWGCGSFGQFTRPRKIVLQVPVNLLFIRGFFGVAISTTKDRKVYTWGNNSYGELGCGSIESAKEPIEVAQLSNIKLDNFACGVNFFIATSRDNDIVAALTKDKQSDYKSQYSSNRKREEDYIRNFASKSKTAVKESEKDIDQLVKSTVYRQAFSREQGRSSAKKKESQRMFEQQIAVSKNCRNYEELFISLSADYETLLGRYKQMESSLQLKNKSQLCQLEQQNSILREQNAKLRAVRERNAELQEQLASKLAEFKQYRQKKQSSQSQLSQQVKDLNSKVLDLEASYRSTKEQLRNTLKKLSTAQQQLSKRSLQMKQKRSVIEENDSLKFEVKSQNEQIEALAKNNKSLKEELRAATKKMKDIEESLEVQSENNKDSLERLNKRQEQLESLRHEQQQLLKQGKQANLLLKNANKKITSLQEEIASKQQQIAHLEQINKSKQQQLRRSQKKKNEHIQSKTQRDNAKDLQIQMHLKTIANLQAEIVALQLRQKELLKSIDEVNKSKHHQLLKKESELIKEHQNAETDLYKEISALEQEKERVSELNDKGKTEKQQLKQRIQQCQQDLSKCQNELIESFKNLDRMKQVHDLNEIRVAELKSILKKEQENSQEAINLLKSETKRLQEERTQFLNLIQEMKDKKGKESAIYQDKILQLENEKEQLSQQAQHLEIELSYEKEYHAKCEFSIKDLTQSRDNAFREKSTLQQEIQEMKEKIKEQTLQLEKSKSYRKDIEVLNLQLQRVESNASKYKQQIEELLKEKEEIVRQLRKELQKKQKDVENHEERYGNDVGKLNRQIKDLQRKLGQKAKELTDAKKMNDTLRTQLENAKESLNKNQRKFAFKDEQLEKEMKEHEKTTQEFNNLRRQYARLKSETQELENKNESNQSEKRQLQGRVADKKREIELLQAEIRRAQAACDGLRKQSQFAKNELQQSNWALQQANRLNSQLQRANCEFSANQQHYSARISQLEARIFEMQQQNKSYTPRYESMMEKNRELEDRNRQLSDMVNRAIQIQAEAYKTNILKEVKINTGEILQQIKEEQEYKSKGRRKENSNKESEASRVEIENAHESFDISNTPKLTEEPYTKLMNQKISAHKKKLSESAQKLAGILSGSNQESQIEESHAKQFVRSVNRKEEDYEIVNSQMDSLNQQKNQFIQKITSFAEKLKIL